MNRDFNTYILRAIDLVAATRLAKGYGAAAFTQDLPFGDGILKASRLVPTTMCVAAQLEIFVEALNLYAVETRDFTAYTFYPKITWERLRPSDLRGQIWMVDGAPTSGAAEALRNFGMGQTTSFREMQPGDFLNFNRCTGTGHGVVFLGYLDADGNEVAEFSDGVCGFVYFSSQGKGRPDAGLGYRSAFFGPPRQVRVPDSRRPDWNVIPSKSQRLLCAGYALSPSAWTKVIGPPWMPTDKSETEGEFNAEYFDGSS